MKQNLLHTGQCFRWSNKFIAPKIERTRICLILSILDTSQQLQKVHYPLDRLKQISSHKDIQIYVFMDLTMCLCTSILHTFINGIVKQEENQTTTFGH